MGGPDIEGRDRVGGSCNAELRRVRLHPENISCEGIRKDECRIELQGSIREGEERETMPTLLRMRLEFEEIAGQATDGMSEGDLIEAMDGAF